MNITYRLSTEEDSENILLLMRDCFERDFRTDWFEWFNWKCPAGRSRLYLAIDEDTGQFAGSYTTWPIRVKYNEEVYKASTVVNVMTHPDYQSLGLFVAMGLHALVNEIGYNSRLSFGIPNAKAARGHLKIDWDILAYLDFVVKYKVQNYGFKAREIVKFDNSVDELIWNTSREFNLLVLKDHKFLNWRYVDRPDRDYTIYAHILDDKIQGYIVLKYFEERGHRKTHIMDILAPQGHIFEDLLQAAESFAYTRDCNELNAWQIDHSIYENWFKGSGFETTTGNLLIIHPNYPGLDKLNSTNWWFALGDNDVY